MLHRRAIRRVVRSRWCWLLAVIAGLILVAGVGSLRWRVAWERPWFRVELHGASIYVGTHEHARATRFVAYRAQRPLQWAPDYHVYQNWWFLRAPLWMPLSGIGLLMGAAYWRAARLRPGYCPGCDYDLQGLAQQGETIRCPECGRVAPKQRRADSQP